MQRKFFTWIIYFMLFVGAVYGQDDKKDKLHFLSHEGWGFNIRGKAITFVIIEDSYFTTATIGGELIYNSHSLGIDGTYFRWRYEQDDYEDVAMYENYDRRKYLLIDYKFGFLNWKRNQIYYNLYYKTGTYKMWYTPQDYDLSLEDSVLLNNKSVGTFQEVGMGIGHKRNFRNSRLGIDISANFARRFSITDKLTFSSYDVSRFEDNVKEIRNSFYMRLNLFYNLIR